MGSFRIGHKGMASATNVAMRYLMGGELHVPEPIVKEVTEWAVSYWAYQSAEWEIHPRKVVENDVAWALDHAAKISTWEKRILGTLSKGNTTKAWELYSEFLKEFRSTLDATQVQPPYEWDFHPDVEKDSKWVVTNLQIFFHAITAFYYEEATREEERARVIDRRVRFFDRFHPRNEPKRKVKIKGNETHYPLLKGKEFPLTVEFQLSMGAAAWNPSVATISFSTVYPWSEDFLRLAVIHELRHAMQSFMVAAKGADPKKIDRSMGGPPRRVRTPTYQQGVGVAGIDPTMVHDLDDIEFQTELGDAKLLLRGRLNEHSVKSRREVFDLFVENYGFLKALKSVPEGRGKWQIAVKELGKLI